MYKGTMYHVQRIAKRSGSNESLLFAIQYLVYYLTTTGLCFGTSIFLSRLRSNDYFSTTG